MDNCKVVVNHKTHHYPTDADYVDFLTVVYMVCCGTWNILHFKIFRIVTATLHTHTEWHLSQVRGQRATWALRYVDLLFALHLLPLLSLA